MKEDLRPNGTLFGRLESAGPEDAAGTEASDQWDYEDSGPKILWGRVIALGAFVLIAFVVGLRLGHATAPTGVPESDYQRLKGELRATQRQVTQLQGAIAQTQRPERALRPAKPKARASAPAPSPTPAAPTGPTKTYTVKPGDTLQSIAARFYGTRSLYTYIAQANNIVDPSLVPVGQRLTIPPKP